MADIAAEIILDKNAQIANAVRCGRIRSLKSATNFRDCLHFGGDFYALLLQN